MTEQEILDSNVLIAQFMGGKFYQELSYLDKKEEVWVPHFGICRMDTVDIGKGKILEYHKSWDWLMKVVEKITFTNMFDDNYSYCYIYIVTSYVDKSHYVNLFVREDDQFNGESKTSKIEAVYEAAVSFIKWYNKNKENADSSN